MSEYEIEKRISALCDMQVNSLHADVILRKAKLNLVSASKKSKRFSITSLFSSRRGIAVFAALIMVIAALCTGLPIGLRHSNTVVENMTIVNGNMIREVGTHVQLAVNIKYVGKKERTATSDDVKFTSNNQNAAIVNKDGVVAILDAGKVSILVESINKTADGNKIFQTVYIPVAVSSIPSEVNLNTKVTLPKAISEAEVAISVKFDGEDVRVAEVDAITGYAISLTLEKVVFNNDDKMSFYPTELGQYSVLYSWVDALSGEWRQVRYEIVCRDSLAPVLVHIDDRKIPSEWGTRVFECDAETPENLIEASNVIWFPYPDFIDNSGNVTVAFRIFKMVDDIHVNYINVDDIDKNASIGDYYGDIDFANGGFGFDITQCVSFDWPEFELGLFIVEYIARDNSHNMTILRYEILFSQEYIKAS